jgi:hypothetical protein
MVYRSTNGGSTCIPGAAVRQARLRFGQDLASRQNNGCWSAVSAAPSLKTTDGGSPDPAALFGHSLRDRRFGDSVVVIAGQDSPAL